MTTLESRRSAVGALGFALAMLPGLGLAQQAARVRRIGVLFRGRPRIDKGAWAEFVDELARRGWVEGQNLRFDMRYAALGTPQLADFAAELVRLAPDVLFAAAGTDTALALKRASNTIPVVFYTSADPVGFGLVESLARPGGNVTGNATLSFAIEPKSLQFLTDATGGFRRMVYLQHKNFRTFRMYPAMQSAMTAAAVAQGATIQFVDVEPADSIEALMKRLTEQGIDAAYVSLGSLALRRRIAALLVEHRLPSIGDPDTDDEDDGALIRYRRSLQETASNAANYVDKILRGARPADLPVRQPTKFELIVNLKTAKALGLTIPQSILLRADKLIE